MKHYESSMNGRFIQLGIYNHIFYPDLNQLIGLALLQYSAGARQTIKNGPDKKVEKRGLRMR